MQKDIETLLKKISQKKQELKNIQIEVQEKRARYITKSQSVTTKKDELENHKTTYNHCLAKELDTTRLYEEHITHVRNYKGICDELKVIEDEYMTSRKDAHTMQNEVAVLETSLENMYNNTISESVAETDGV